MSLMSLPQSLTWEEVASNVPQNATDTERLMVAVRYRFENDQADTTDMTVIVNDYFRRARWPRPTNLAATANHCASKGWLSEAGRAEGRKLWRITRKGYDATKLQV
jgi:hypothetical protein